MRAINWFKVIIFFMVFGCISFNLQKKKHGQFVILRFHHWLLFLPPNGLFISSSVDAKCRMQNTRFPFLLHNDIFILCAIFFSFCFPHKIEWCMWKSGHILLKIVYITHAVCTNPFAFGECKHKKNRSLWKCIWTFGKNWSNRSAVLTSFVGGWSIFNKFKLIWGLHYGGSSYGSNNKFFKTLLCRSPMHSVSNWNFHFFLIDKLSMIIRPFFQYYLKNIRLSHYATGFLCVTVDFVKFK